MVPIAVANMVGTCGTLVAASTSAAIVPLTGLSCDASRTRGAPK